MALQSYYVGSVGPFFYDDADVVQPDATDVDLPQDLRPQSAFRTSGQVAIGQLPSDPEHVLRLSDISPLLDDTLAAAEEYAARLVKAERDADFRMMVATSRRNAIRFGRYA